MEDNNDLNIHDIIESGRRQIRNGHRPVDVFKFVRSKVENPDLLAEIMEQINGKKVIEPKSIIVPKSYRETAKIKEKRAYRKAKYAVEDFRDTIKLMNRSGTILISVAAILGVFALIFEVPNWGHICFSFLTGTAFLVLENKLNWEDSSLICSVFGGFTLGFLMEILIFGIPYSLIPGIIFLTSSGIIGLISLLISFSPIVYVIIRLATLYPFISMIIQKRKMNSFPDILIKRAKMELGSSTPSLF